VRKPDHLSANLGTTVLITMDISAGIRALSVPLIHIGIMKNMALHAGHVLTDLRRMLSRQIVCLILAARPLHRQLPHPLRPRSYHVFLPNIDLTKRRMAVRNTDHHFVANLGTMDLFMKEHISPDIRAFDVLPARGETMMCLAVAPGIARLVKKDTTLMRNNHTAFHERHHLPARHNVGIYLIYASSVRTGRAVSP
jgi:hypothetical protein